MSNRFNYGGQAVIEGVMMRGPDRMAVAVRKAGKEIAVYPKPIRMWTVKLRRYPLLRGIAALVEALALGLEALILSANEAVAEDEQLGPGETALTVGLALVVAVALFMVTPTVLLGFVRPVVGNVLLLNAFEGLTRLAILLAYIFSISRFKDIQRVLEYHGAEHMVIHTYEAGEDLTVANARRHSPFHARCGTSFLLFVVVVSVVTFSFFGWPGIWERMAIRLALLPVIAAVSYEVIRLGGRSNLVPVRLLVLPGLWLQRLTARRPDDGQLEVAIAALEALLERDASR